jgi:hypothetical protein
MTTDEARVIHPSGYYNYHDDKRWAKRTDGTEVEAPYGNYEEWPMPNKVTVKLIGIATDDVAVNSVVCASYHAG